MSTRPGSWRSRRTSRQLAALGEWWELIESQARELETWQRTAWARWDSEPDPKLG